MNEHQPERYETLSINITKSMGRICILALLLAPIASDPQPRRRGSSCKNTSSSWVLKNSFYSCSNKSKFAHCHAQK